MLNETLRSRWFSTCLLAGLLLLIGLAVVGIGFGGRTLKFTEADPNSAGVTTPVPVAKLQKLFDYANWPKNVVDPATMNPFVTTHFIPQVVAVAPPTTRKYDITYQGYYETAGGPRRVMIRLGETLTNLTIGSPIVTNLWVADAAFKKLTLTNSAFQTNVLELSVKKEVEVPLK